MAQSFRNGNNIKNDDNDDDDDIGCEQRPFNTFYNLNIFRLSERDALVTNKTVEIPKSQTWNLISL